MHVEENVGDSEKFGCGIAGSTKLRGKALPGRSAWGADDDDEQMDDPTRSSHIMLSPSLKSRVPMPQDHATTDKPKSTNQCTERNYNAPELVKAQSAMFSRGAGNFDRDVMRRAASLPHSWTWNNNTTQSSCQIGSPSMTQRNSQTAARSELRVKKKSMHAIHHDWAALHTATCDGESHLDSNNNTESCACETVCSAQLHLRRNGSITLKHSSFSPSPSLASLGVHLHETASDLLLCDCRDCLSSPRPSIPSSSCASHVSNLSPRCESPTNMQGFDPTI